MIQSGRHSLRDLYDHLPNGAYDMCFLAPADIELAAGNVRDIDPRGDWLAFSFTMTSATDPYPRNDAFRQIA